MRSCVWVRVSAVEDGLIEGTNLRPMHDERDRPCQGSNRDDDIPFAANEDNHWKMSGYRFTNPIQQLGVAAVL